MCAMSRSAMPRRSRRPRRCSRARAARRPYVSLLGSRKHNFFTDGGGELFDCAGQGRIDVFFLSGGEIDGEGNINLVSIGDHENRGCAFPGSFGSALSLFRRAEGDPVPDRAFAAHAGAEGGFISAPGAAPQRLSPGRTDRAHHQPLSVLVRPARATLPLESVHPGPTVDGGDRETGFDFDRPAKVPATPAPSARHCADARAVAPRARRGLSAICRQGVWCKGDLKHRLHPMPRHGLYASDQIREGTNG